MHWMADFDSPSSASHNIYVIMIHDVGHMRVHLDALGYLRSAPGPSLRKITF